MPFREVVPEGLDRLERAQWIAGQVGVDGEVANIWEEDDRITIPMTRPGERLTIRVDLAAGSAVIEHRSTTLWDRLIYLHKTPGPHLAGFRGNWVFTRLWRGLVDGTVALLLFSSASGVYLWLLARAQRRAGLALLGAGGCSFVLLLLALTA